MGGDQAPRVPIKAALEASQKGLPVTLVGDRAVLEPRLQKRNPKWRELVSLVHASQTIEMGERPSAAIRKKKDASIRVAARMVANGEARAMVSAGNSGAVMAAGLLEVGRIPGARRPALASAFPSKKAPVVVLDLGAEIHPQPKDLEHFAIMGAIYARVMLGRAQPKLGLLCNGSEEVKGTPLVQETHERLAALEGPFDYVGYCEGRDIFEGQLDVVVTDGFTGNVVLKSVEGLIDAVRTILGAEIKKNPLAGAGALLVGSVVKSLERRIDYEGAGAAPLLGLRGSCLIAHGASSTYALTSALFTAQALSKSDLIAQLTAWPLTGS